jgi:hypothetical protein
MRKGVLLLAVGLVGAVATCLSSASAENVDDRGRPATRIAEHGTSREFARTDAREIDFTRIVPWTTKAPDARRPAGKRPLARGPIVVGPKDCDRERIPEVRAQLKVCSFGAYAKANQRPGAKTGYGINWTQVAIRPIRGWCLTRVAGSQKVLTSKVISSTPRGSIRPGPHRATARIVDEEDGRGLGRMTAGADLRAGTLRGWVDENPKGDRAQWRWTGSLRKKTLRIVAGSAVAFPVPDDGLLIGKERFSFRTAPCEKR